MSKKIIITIVSILAIGVAGVFLLKRSNSTRPILSYLPNIPEKEVFQDNTATNNNNIEFIGPRKNIPQNSPKKEGFWSFSTPLPGVLSRSGQPTLEEFQWLKQNGWKGVIDLRVDGERNEIALDSKIPGFNELGFKYLELQIPDGSAPTDKQGEEFLKFVTNPENQPALVHCHAGVGRTGTMIALYRYSVQGWPMEKAIEESELFRSGVSKEQKVWLQNWAKNHEAGKYF